MNQPLDLGTLEIQPDPVALEALARRRDDQRELFRLADARRWAAYPPLMRLLGAVEPS